MTEKNTRAFNYFHPQAFLMYKLSNSGTIKKSDLTPGGQGVSVYKISGKYEPAAVMSKVYNSRNSSGSSIIKNNFFNLETYKINALVPELRLYKDDGGTLTPFYFPISNLTEDAASLTGPSRVAASGIKSFSVEYQGTDPFTAPRYLKSNINLYIDNLQNVFADPEPGYARLADLFTLSVPNPLKIKGKDGTSVLSTELARPIEVAATLGYTIAPKNRDLFTQEEIEEIISSNISLRMNVFSHAISINQDGTATIDIHYTARIDNAGRDKIFSVLDSPEDLLARADLKRLFSTKEEDSDKAKKVNEKEIMETKAKSQKAKLAEFREVMEILGEKKIYSIKAKSQDVANYSLLAYFDGIGKFENKALEAALGPSGAGNELPPAGSILGLTENNRTSLTKVLKELDSSEREIYYITFGDFLEAFVKKIKSSLDKTKKLIQNANSSDGVKRLKNSGISSFLTKTKKEKSEIKKVIDGAIKKLSTFKILLADVEYKAYDSSGEKGASIKRINIGDIPISLYTYQKFVYDAIVNSNRNTFVLPQFLELCLSDGGLLHKAFAEWAQAGVAPNVIADFPSFTSAVFSGPKLRASVAKKQFVSTESVSPQKNFTASSIEDESDYFVIYQTPTRELSKEKPGDSKQDSKQGIYHFEIGKNRGLFKQISFSRIDVPFVQEQLMTNQVGMYDELKMVYKADIEMVGNNLFFPGSQIFVDPGTIGFGNPRDIDSAAYKLGLGGYYTVLGVSTSVVGGQSTTKLSCMFEARVGGQAPDTSPDLPPTIAGYISEKKTSRDDEAQAMPNLAIEPVEYYAMYYDDLLNLTDSENGNPVLSEDLARVLSEDYQRLPDQRPANLKGVYRRQADPNSEIVIYHLINGRSVKIDRASSEEVVSLIVNYNTFPAG